jgi:N utilization substance protein B
MATRRQAREWIVQLLFQLDLNPTDIEDALAQFWVDKNGGVRGRAFVEKTVRGVREHVKSIDAMISRCSDNWNIKRMASTDRNVMRVAVYEMMYCEDTPAVVAINEAVDIAKYFNCTESGRFVNGVLDRVRKELKRPGRDSGEAGS